MVSERNGLVTLLRAVPDFVSGLKRTIFNYRLVRCFSMFALLGLLIWLYPDQPAGGTMSEIVQRGMMRFDEGTLPKKSYSYDDYITLNRKDSLEFDAFHHTDVKCVRDRGVRLEDLSKYDFAYAKPNPPIPLVSKINIYFTEPKERTKALERVDKLMEECHRSYHPDGFDEEEQEQDTSTFYDFATWMMQRWSGLQGYHYGITDDVCHCNRLACSMANLFVHIIAGMDGKNKRVLDSGCGWSPLGRLLTHKFDGLQYTGITSSKRGHDVAESFAKDFGYADRAKIVHTNFINRLPFGNGSFDYVFNVESLFHHPNHFDYIEEISRILAPGGEFRVMDYFNPKTKSDLSVEEIQLEKCVSTYWGFANFPVYIDFEKACDEFGLTVVHRYDLYHKVYDFTLQSLQEDLQDISRYVSAVANKRYNIQGMYTDVAFNGEKLKRIELENLSELLGSKCNDLLLANGGHHYTMYVVRKPD